MRKEEKMKFKIDPIFEKYWPPLPDEKFIILEKSILDEGLRENLIVWQEKNILLDGHQRLKILQKHKIPFGDRITELSFPDEVHAKHWVHIAQSARRGDAPLFLSIIHVLEFEPIYREEAKKRQADGGTKHGKLLQTKGMKSCLNEAGLSTGFMARDAGAGQSTVEKVLYIQTYNPERFEELKIMAKAGTNARIDQEYAEAYGLKRGKETNVPIDQEALRKFKSAREMRSFANAVVKHKAPVGTQKQAAEAYAKSEEAATDNFIEDAITRRLPKRSAKEKEKSGLARIKDKMAEIAVHLNKAVAEIRELRDLQSEYGDDLYFRSLAETPEFRAAFGLFIIAAKSFKNGGKYEEKETAD
jgi:hypothetical protein